MTGDTGIQQPLHRCARQAAPPPAGDRRARSSSAMAGAAAGRAGARRRSWSSTPASAAAGRPGRDLQLEDGTDARDRRPAAARSAARLSPAASAAAASPARLIVAPADVPSCPPTSRTWGWAIQLYAARSRRSWGIGDLADLRWLGRWAREQQAGIALINPLAAPAPTAAAAGQPVLSRRAACFRSPLYLRIEEVDGRARPPTASRELARAARRLTASG